jgi:hypothetical protein
VNTRPTRRELERRLSQAEDILIRALAGAKPAGFNTLLPNPALGRMSYYCIGMRMFWEVRHAIEILRGQDDPTGRPWREQRTQEKT